MPKIKHLRDRVKDILQQHPTSRDNDNEVIIKIWEQDRVERRVQAENLEMFFERFVNRQFSNPESIRRCRQLLQRANPELRGTLTEMRQMEADVTKEEIRTFNQPIQTT